MKQIITGILMTVFFSLPALSQTAPKGLALQSQAPDFSVPDQEGKDWQLSSALSKGPVVLVFYRGHWCPHCNRYLNTLQDSLTGFKNRNATLVAISPELYEGISQTVSKTRADYPILHDPGMQIMKKYDVAYNMDEKTIKAYKGYGLDMTKINGPENGANLPVPAVFVINKEGKIIFRHFDKDYTKRASIKEIFQSLDAASGK